MTRAKLADRGQIDWGGEDWGGMWCWGGQWEEDWIC